MKASETKLQPIIEGTKQYLVPLFQRTYSWDKKEWEVLWDDLIDLSEMENPREHFMGSIVTTAAISVPEGVAKFLLIDGQQRLTTIFIILILLRDKFIEQDQTGLADEINNTLLINPYKKGIDRYKLLPTHLDRSAFKKLIDQQPIDGLDNQIIRAYRFFERKIQQGQIEMIRLKDIISNHFSVVSIVLDQGDNPHLVFESLNAKGKALTQSDLIRNFFFMRIHLEEQESVYRTYWKPMQDALGESLTDFIRHYLMRDGSNVKQNEVYFSLKDRVGQGNAMESLSELARFAKYYHKLLCPEHESNHNVRQCLHRINRLEATTTYPFLLNCYNDYYGNNLSVSEFSEVLNIIENFLIRRFVCNVPTNQLNKIFPSLYAIITKKGTSDLLNELKLSLQSKGYPKDNEFKARITDTSLYGSGDRVRKTKLILERIEESYNHKEQVAFNELSIEHIMPQTLTESWQTCLGDDWEITYELLLHTIGNLTLTAYNTELSNDDYNTKKERLVNSHLELNKYFAKVNSWTKDDIELRAEFLAGKALEVWQYFGELKVSEETHDVTGTTPCALWILGQRFEVNTWRDVLEQTLNTIADLEPDKFEQILSRFPRFVGRDKKKFRVVRELRNGTFIEVNLSAKSIASLCYQALDVIELTNEEWKIEIA